MIVYFARLENVVLYFSFEEYIYILTGLKPRAIMTAL